MDPSKGFEPIRFLTIDALDANAIELPSTIARDLNGRVGAVLTYDHRGRRATLLGWPPYVDHLAKRSGRVHLTSVLAHVALGWPENWLTEDGALSVRPKRMHRQPRPKRTPAPPPEWVDELLAALDKAIAADIKP